MYDIPLEMVDPKVRFWNKVNYHNWVSERCWEWLGFIGKNGYGQFRLTTKKNEFAHRASYFLFKGLIPNKMLVLHKCDNRKCVNPSHLFLGTYKDNIIDCIKKGRFIGGEKHYKAKLTTHSAHQIVYDYIINTPNQHQLAKNYNISVPVINRILNGGTHYF